jgi:hypothetical protein
MGKILLAELSTLPVNRLLWETLKTPLSRFEYLTKAITLNDVRRLKSLVYDGFLRTLYWTIIRDYVLFRDGGKCSRCGTAERVNVHHKSYQYQGEEYRAMDTLMLLCRSCHSGGHQFDAAKDTKDVINAAVLQLAGSHRAAMSGTSKQNKNYDPRTMMNLKMYGDIRGYQGENDDGL